MNSIFLFENIVYERHKVLELILMVGIILFKDVLYPLRTSKSVLVEKGIRSFSLLVQSYPFLLI